MTHDRRDTGRQGEAIARQRVTALGLTVLATNWQSPLGEVDIVARDGDCLVFVEVRARHGARFGTPEESVDGQKQRKLAALADVYVQQSGWDGPWRIDVVAVVLDRDGTPVRVAHYPGAVGR